LTRFAQRLSLSLMASAIVGGIDVGGTKKGFHAVALRKRRVVATLTSCSAEEVTVWCIEQGVTAIGVDAPCCWSVRGRSRPCERELASHGISAFSTPTRAAGEAHPFYRWMVNGLALYTRLASHYRLYDGRLPFAEPVCFETFPHAIASALAGQRLLAGHKRMDRRRLLQRVGIAVQALTSIDHIDAALCALSAQHVLANRFHRYGDAAEGFILVPAVSVHGGGG
jgi:predicted nuclease with RNAse H fold